MRIVAQADTLQKLHMALSSFRAGVLIFSETLAPDIPALAEAAKGPKTRLIAVAETPENSSQLLKNGVHGLMYRSVSGPALVECVRKVAAGQSWVQDMESASQTSETDAVGARGRDRLTGKEVWRAKHLLDSWSTQTKVGSSNHKRLPDPNRHTCLASG